MTGREDRNWPGYLLGGRIRTSTVALLVAFMGIWWVYDTYEPAPAPPVQVPAVDVVPPGFIPDPAYTWVPRTDVAPRTAVTTTPTTTETSPTSPTSPTTPTSGVPGAPSTAETSADVDEPGTPEPAESTATTAPTTGPTPATPTP